ncbi:MAG TPA: metallopeptidase family protein [Streptosporangiaceae bacterium]|nr:metallopeptidase family protein [Streptosporangiaceae bacterium]
MLSGETSAGPTPGPGSGSSRVRRRDRHGRGLRGPLSPPEVPLHRSRAEQFGDLVLEAVARLEPRWESELSHIEFAVQEVPDHDPPEDAPDAVPLASLDPGEPDPDDPAHGPRIILYRRALMARAEDDEELADLVLDVVVEEVARLLGVEPETIDPDYDEEE